MKYTVVVKTIISSNGDFERTRWNNIPKRIIKFLLKYHFSFKVGIANNIVNIETAKNYIEVYTKDTFFSLNRTIDHKLRMKLNRLGKRV